ncbi:MAG: NUDIX hydrolase [Rubrobacter sp.]|nr:NUDIX hydrolase [Rubrobacter sp.]
MGKDRTSSGMEFSIRIGVIVEREGVLLLVRHKKSDWETYWVLPGGRLEPGETIPNCAERELLEETGLRGRFTRVLYVSEFLAENRHTVDVTAQVEVNPSEEAQLGSDPEEEAGSERTLQELHWVRFEELGRITLLPGFIRDRIAKDAARNWQGGEVYLGKADG